MILGDDKIHELMECGYLQTDCEKRINPASLNVRIGNSFLVPCRKLFGGIRLGSRVKYRSVRIKEGEVFRLRPGQFALATTMEHICVPNDLAAFVQGRSSIGRAGLTVQNAGFIDPGFSGHITLELKNETTNTILIPPGYPVAQIVFEEATQVMNPYRGKYSGQIDATGSRMYLDDEGIKNG